MFVTTWSLPFYTLEVFSGTHANIIIVKHVNSFGHTTVILLAPGVVTARTH